jgi:hypothetical protein
VLSHVVIVVPRHSHVHGANLGLTAQTYRTLGGFPPLPVGEDRALVDQAAAAGHRVHRATDLPVRTSARASARAPAGFAAHLLALSTYDAAAHPTGTG